MNNKSSILSVETILQHLEDKGYVVNRDNLPVLSDQSTATVAWYQYLLLAIGVFAAFLCFLLLLGVSDFFEMGHLGQALWATGFIVVAVVMYRQVVGAQSHSTTLSAVFVTQVTFVLMLAGEGLLFYHISDYFVLTHIWQLTVVAIILTAVTFPLYPVVLARIVSLAVVLFFIQLLPMAPPFGGETAWVLQSVLLLVFLSGLVYLSFSWRWADWRYLRYALIISLFIQLTFSPFAVADTMSFFVGHNFFPSDTDQAILAYPSWMIAAVLCGCAVYLADQQRKFYGLWLLCAALLVLAYFLPPTLFFALLIMVLGYATHDRVMTGLGLALMPYYLFDYYYTLQWSLLDKSLLLMASGVVLLLVAFAVAKLPSPAQGESV